MSKFIKIKSRLTEAANIDIDLSLREIIRSFAYIIGNSWRAINCTYIGQDTDTSLQYRIWCLDCLDISNQNLAKIPSAKKAAWTKFISEGSLKVTLESVYDKVTDQFSIKFDCSVFEYPDFEGSIPADQELDITTVFNTTQDQCIVDLTPHLSMRQLFGTKREFKNLGTFTAGTIVNDNLEPLITNFLNNLCNSYISVCGTINQQKQQNKKSAVLSRLREDNNSDAIKESLNRIGYTFLDVFRDSKRSYTFEDMDGDYAKSRYSIPCSALSVEVLRNNKIWKKYSSEGTLWLFADCLYDSDADRFRIEFECNFYDFPDLDGILSEEREEELVTKVSDLQENTTVDITKYLRKVSGGTNIIPFADAEDIVDFEVAQMLRSLMFKVANTISEFTVSDRKSKILGRLRESAQPEYSRDLLVNIKGINIGFPTFGVTPPKANFTIKIPVDNQDVFEDYAPDAPNLESKCAEICYEYVLLYISTNKNLLDVIDLSVAPDIQRVAFTIDSVVDDKTRKAYNPQVWSNRFVEFNKADQLLDTKTSISTNYLLPMPTWATRIYDRIADLLETKIGRAQVYNSLPITNENSGAFDALKTPITSKSRILSKLR